MTPRRSQTPIEIFGDWAELVLRRKIYEWIPALGRALNAPHSKAFAGDFATRRLEDQIEGIALGPDEVAQAQPVLSSARRNDAGDVSTYPEGRSKLRSLLLLIEDCAVLGHTMALVDKSRTRVLARDAGPLDVAMAPPAWLRSRQAPTGACYALTCGGDLARFLLDDMIPLLHFLRGHGDEIGPLHIVTRPDFPPFVKEGLQALCAAHPSVEILELRGNERLDHVRALWLSRAPDARDWSAVTREEADALGALLRARHHLPAPSEPDQLLFVSPGNATAGAITNEAEVFTGLLDYGFEFFLPHDDDHRAAIEAFQSARVVVAAHGAALADVLFCQPGTLVIELFPSNQVRSAFCWLALRLGLRYRGVSGYQVDAAGAFVAKRREVMAQVEAELGPLPEEEEDEEDEDVEDEEGDGEEGAAAPPQPTDSPNL